MRSYTTRWDGDPPEIVAAERLQAIAYDQERIADALEQLVEHVDEPDPVGP